MARTKTSKRKAGAHWIPPLPAPETVKLAGFEAWLPKAGASLYGSGIPSGQWTRRVDPDDQFNPDAVLKRLEATGA